MPSASITDPIGPRSVDEMLGVVYGRADRLRRRRALQRVGGGAAALALVLAALVTLGEGDDSAQLRVVDDPGAHQETAPPEQSDAEPGAAEDLLNSHPPAPSSGDAGPRTPPTTAPAAPPVTSPPKVQADAAASLEAWMRVDDAANDSVPEDWYYDVIAASMELDRRRDVVVFTTRYRSPDAATTASRDARLLESQFDYGTHTYSVEVDESDNRLSGVRIEGSNKACGSCTAEFDATRATLVVTVPLAVLNAEVARHDDSKPLGSGAEITDLVARTAQIDESLGEVDADITGQGRLA